MKTLDPAGANPGLDTPLPEMTQKTNENSDLNTKEEDEKLKSQNENLEK